MNANRHDTNKSCGFYCFCFVWEVECHVHCDAAKTSQSVYFAALLTLLSKRVDGFVQFSVCPVIMCHFLSSVDGK